MIVNLCFIKYRRMCDVCLDRELGEKKKTTSLDWCHAAGFYAILIMLRIIVVITRLKRR